MTQAKLRTATFTRHSAEISLKMKLSLIPLNLSVQYGLAEEEHGLDFMRARFYDSKGGRFNNLDPIGLLGLDANLYRYVGNRPTDRLDPTGLRENSFHGQSYNNYVMREIQLYGEAAGRQIRDTTSAVYDTITAPFKAAGEILISEQFLDDLFLYRQCYSSDIIYSRRRFIAGNSDWRGWISTCISCTLQRLSLPVLAYLAAS